MAIEALLLKTAIKDAFEAEVNVGQQFEGFNVYDYDNLSGRVFYPFIMVYTPMTTLIKRFVGGARTYQLVARIVLAWSDRERMVLSGVEYKGEDIGRILSDYAEEIIEDIQWPSTILMEGVPNIRSFADSQRIGDYTENTVTINYVANYVVS